MIFSFQIDDERHVQAESSQCVSESGPVQESHDRCTSPTSLICPYYFAHNIDLKATTVSTQYVLLLPLALISHIFFLLLEQFHSFCILPHVRFCINIGHDNKRCCITLIKPCHPFKRLSPNINITPIPGCT